MSMELMNYQQDLLNNIIKSLDKDGRAGLELFTSGGKSLIGLKLIEHYVDKTNKKIMWIAPRAALNNVNERYIQNSEYVEYVECVSLNVLSRLEKILKKKSEYKQYSLIIIDEAHKLMAKNAYEQFQKELEKFNKKIKIFAMTASSYRNLDGIRSLEEITQGGMIYRYNLSDAINEDIANPVIYYGTALEYNKRCYQALDTLRTKYGNIPYVKYILNHVTDKLRESENNTESKVVDFISSKVKFNANSGDRHIVFFSRVAELKEQKDMVYNIMRKWYKDTKDVDINIIEYHGELSTRESNKALKLINTAAEPNKVDVVLTVDKGAESIHPDNIRSIILFRGTQSIVKFTQMIGRVITLTINNHQANYVFDFCKSVSLIGANSITVGHRKLEDRTDLKSEMTPEQLLGDVLRIKSRVPNDNFIEVNLDQTIEELNELFDRLGAMYDMLESTQKITEFLRDKLNTIDKEYNGNIAKYLMKTKPELGKLYRKVQVAIMYQALSMGDTTAISEMMQKEVGDRVFFTLKMSKEQEDDIKTLKEITECKDYNSLSVDTQKDFLKKLAIQLLTDKLPTATERYIQKQEGLYEELLEMFIGITPSELGCNSVYKSNLGTLTIRNIRQLRGSMMEQDWFRWRAAYYYIKYLNVNEDIPESLGDGNYAIAMQKYARHINKDINKYKLSDRDNNLGARVLRVLEYIINGTESSMLPLDENFALEIINGVYNSNTYVKELLRCQGFENIDAFISNIKDKLPISSLVSKIKNDPTEDNLVKLINYMVKRGIDKQTQDNILHDSTVVSIMENAGRNNDTTLTRYCISKLINQDDQMVDIVKKAAKNGLGYDTIVALAFPSEAYEDAKIAIQEMSSDDEHPKSSTLKSRYCRMPYATSTILMNIRMNILPKKICKNERKLIQYMSE